MQNEFMTQWFGFYENIFNSYKELGTINGKIAEKFANQQLEFANTCLDTNVKYFALLSDTKGYKDLFSGCANLTAQFNEKIAETMSKTMGVVNESKDELSAWVEKGVESTVAPLKKVVKKAA